ncbi:hypothetical protein [Cellulomonas sp. NTE-D12]|uniref:hypothetical protein n=1 Tax=Cellulomonas sp. NTE-D12 TaxID=2962632 RepID=UPI003081B9B9|nr:hypothetical protein CELD12_03270 [Cellulomonas sp. NTE-D12]
MTVTFSPNRSAAIRAGLIAHARPGGVRGRTWRGIALVLAGALVGGGATAAAFGAASSRVPIARPSGEPSPSLGAAVDAPPGVVPGAPIISLVGTPITRTVSTRTTISLQPRPAAATHARVVVTPTAAGTLSFGTSAGGDNPSASFDAADVTRGSQGASWYDFPLDGTVDSLFLTPSAGFAGTVTVQYVTHIPTRLGVNARGQTFGVSGSAPQGDPDLVAVQATNGKSGYAYAADLEGPQPTSPAGAGTNPEHGRTIPVYESDGSTVIGEFAIG